MQTIKLNNGIEMPILGFGVFQVENEKCQRVVEDALSVGYRLIDTASSYQNEKAVGCAIKNSGIKREDLFVTTKAFIQEMGYEKTKTAFENSLKNLGLDYLDLYLIHMPFGDYYGSYRAMIELYNEGKIKSIGVSNFMSDRIMDLCYNFNVIPAVNQVELHPYYQREAEIKILREYGIQPQAWAPFAEGMNGMFNNPLLSEIAKNHNKSTAQVILKWNIQRNIAVIPKSIHKNRMEENINVFDFELTQEEMIQITALDLAKPQMLDTRVPSEVSRLYNYLENPVLTSLEN
ncbi:MAG: aldo/keto reductase [Clostridium sp.]|nr:aldo/keto reductase [Clostridium sp.]